ncbi:P27 family phage terminase small subunit [Candidatus Pacearchaeota archaeon]|nr:P27 family phage terminase small subunit [Candidatus Pacearchaeota archaeon]
MTAGRPQKPVKQLKLQGTYREDRHGECMQIEPNKPDCPEWLSETAKFHWTEISQMLYDMGMVSKIDHLALSLLVDALADWIKYSKSANMLKVAYYENAAGNLVMHPAITAKNKSWELLLKVVREFGMSPASLRSVAAKPKEDKPVGKDKGRFLSKKA